MARSARSPREQGAHPHARRDRRRSRASRRSVTPRTRSRPTGRAGPVSPTSPSTAGRAGLPDPCVDSSSATGQGWSHKSRSTPSTSADYWASWPPKPQGRQVAIGRAGLQPPRRPSSTTGRAGLTPPGRFSVIPASWSLLCVPVSPHTTLEVPGPGRSSARAASTAHNGSKALSLQLPSLPQLDPELDVQAGTSGSQGTPN